MTPISHRLQRIPRRLSPQGAALWSCASFR